MKRRPLYLHDLTPNRRDGKHVTFWWPVPQKPMPILADQDAQFLKQCGIAAQAEPKGDTTK